MTSDGSAWWLRSITSSEPSKDGDYEANCYMDLGPHPSNENLLEFTARRCDFHSDSYYCQLAARKSMAGVKDQAAAAAAAAAAEVCHPLTPDQAVTMHRNSSSGIWRRPENGIW